MSHQGHPRNPHNPADRCPCPWSWATLAVEGCIVKADTLGRRYLFKAQLLLVAAIFGASEVLLPSCTACCSATAVVRYMPF